MSQVVLRRNHKFGQNRNLNFDRIRNWNFRRSTSHGLFEIHGFPAVTKKSVCSQISSANKFLSFKTHKKIFPQILKEFLHKIVGLSYKGDVRMGWAEDSKKIDKLVEGANEQLRMLYIPLLKKFVEISKKIFLNFFSDKQISVENDEMIEQDNSIQTVFHRLQMLPYFVQRGLCNSYYPSRRFRRYNTNLDIEELIYHISHRYDVPERLDLVLQKIVGHSSKHQSIKNAFTAGISRSFKYIWPKLVKGILRK
ncbi:unnamed protein product [Meloidogyne enterolobii]|uniref:Uncharacterized protein n=1 Tax=Meloidogyne enterolobii TaxID=390850 RepID=A0ACB1A1W5_MELEN